MVQTPIHQAQETSIWWLSPRLAKWLALALLVFGVECWLVVGKDNYGHQHQPLLILAAIICGFIAHHSKRLQLAVENRRATVPPIAMAGRGHDLRSFQPLPLLDPAI